MSKYIIDIEDKPVGGLYKAKGFRTLVFDAEGLSRLEKIEDDREDKTYYYITEEFQIRDAWDTGKDVDLMRKEVGNYFHSFDLASATKDRMLGYLNYGGFQ